jgi:O-acetyl-ADP-ribose deacetylase
MNNYNKIEITNQDITTLDVDVIVNAANSSLSGGGGVDGAIHRAAEKQLLDECITIRNKQGGCPAGEAVITNAGSLKCKKVIHTVGPVWNGGNNNEEFLLSSCYKNSLDLAVKNNLNTIAFPNISTGIYGYPKQEAAKTALKTIIEYLKKNSRIDKIIFSCFDVENYKIYLKEIEEYK